MTYAAEEADRLSEREIATKHLLLGLLREESCLAAGILKDYGVTSARLIEKEPDEPPSDRDDPADRIPNLRNFTEEAEHGDFGPLIGRERELQRIGVILSRRKRNNVAVIGDAGVGKTAIVEGFAQHMGFGALLYEVDASSLNSPRQLDAIIDAVRMKSAILCVDRLFDFPPATALLAPLIARGEFQCIGTGARIDWLTRYFEVVEVRAPDEDLAIRILTALKPRYEKFHSVVFGDGTMEAAVYASGRFLAHRNLPDRAIDLIDEAGTRAKLKISDVVVPEDIAHVIAERNAMPLAAVNAILAQRSFGRLERIVQALAARVPFDGNEWIAFLAAYLARCSKQEADQLVDAIGAVSNEE